MQLPNKLIFSSCTFIAVKDQVWFMSMKNESCKWLNDYYVHVFSEIMDFGYSQNLSPEILKLYITQEGVRSPFSSKVSANMLL